MNIKFVNCPNYGFLNLDLKSSILSLLCRNCKDFTPPLDSWGEGETERDRLSKYLKDEDKVICVYDESKLIGLTHYQLDHKFDQYPELGDHVRLRTTMIDKEYRGLGIAQSLNKFIDDLNQTSWKSAYIVRSTWEQNHIQKHLFDKYGYALHHKIPYRVGMDLKRLFYIKYTEVGTTRVV